MHSSTSTFPTASQVTAQLRADRALYAAPRPDDLTFRAALIVAAGELRAHGFSGKMVPGVDGVQRTVRLAPGLTISQERDALEIIDGVLCRAGWETSSYRFEIKAILRSAS